MRFGVLLNSADSKTKAIIVFKNAISLLLSPVFISSTLNIPIVALSAAAARANETPSELLKLLCGFITFIGQPYDRVSFFYPRS